MYTFSVPKHLKNWLIAVIIFRMAVFPIRYFLAPSQINPETFAKYAHLPLIGSMGFLGAVLPLIWIIPLLLIISNKKVGYQLSVLFGFLLIYINVLDIVYLISPNQNLFLGLFFFYVITGVTIIGLAVASLGYLRSIKDVSPVSMPIPSAPPVPVVAPAPIQNVPHSPNYFVPGIVALVFAFVDFFPFLFLGASFTDPFLGSGSDPILPAIAVLAVALITGWKCGQSILQSIWNGDTVPGAGIGVAFGALNGIAAQLVLYGFSAILIFAAPIGAGLGAGAGAVGASLIFYIVKWTR